MKKKLIYLLTALSAVLLIGCYIARVCYVNRDNEKCDITYVSDKGPLEYNGIRYSISNENIYDINAFFQKYPDAEINYSDEVEVAEKGDFGKQYMLCITLTLENISDSQKEISLTDYIAAGDTWFTSIDPFAVPALNGIESAECQFYPGARAELLMVYEMNEINFSKESFENISKQPFSIMLTGYPNIRRMRLENIKFTAGKVTEEEMKQKKAVKKNIVDDTPAGTVLKIGEEYVGNSIGYRVEDVQITENVSQYKDYQKKFLLDKSLVNKDGSINSLEEEEISKDTKIYMVFVKVKLHNYSTMKKQFYNSLSLGYYIGDNYCSSETAYYTYDGKLKEKGSVFQHKLKAGEETEVVMGFHVFNNKTLWDVVTDLLYMNTTGDGSEGNDPKARRIGTAVYMKIQ